MSNTNHDNPLTTAEVEHLNQLESIVQRGLDIDGDVGNALAHISHARLYRGTHETFEAYLRERWGVARSHALELTPAPEPTNAWERARRVFGDDDVSAVDIRITVHKRTAPSDVESEPWSNPWPAAQSDAVKLRAQLRWLLTQSSGTIADVAHQLETYGTDVDEGTREQLRDDVLALDEELAALKALLLGPVDWDAEHGRLLAGEVPPFDEDDDDSED
jgi:hypothetical protein